MSTSQRDKNQFIWSWLSSHACSTISGITTCHLLALVSEIFFFEYNIAIRLTSLLVLSLFALFSGLNLIKQAQKAWNSLETLHNIEFELIALIVDNLVQYDILKPAECHQITLTLLANKDNRRNLLQNEKFCKLFCRYLS